MLSLRAQDASLTEITKEIGRRLDVETMVQLSLETRVTLEFDHLSLRQAITALREHATIGYVERGAGKEPRAITKILAFKKAGVAPSAEATQAVARTEEKRFLGPERHGRDATTPKELPRPGGLRFEFDLS
jgi:hypothetical protein